MNWDVKTQNLVANPVPELMGLRGSTLASEHIAALPTSSPHVVANTGARSDAALDDFEVK